MDEHCCIAKECIPKDDIQLAKCPSVYIVFERVINARLIRDYDLIAETERLTSFREGGTIFFTKE